MVHDEMGQPVAPATTVSEPKVISHGFSIFKHVISYFVAVIVIFALLDVPLSKFMFTKKCA